MVHLFTVFGKKKVATAVPIKNKTNKGIPVNLQLVIRFPIRAVITVPILDFLKTLTRIDDNKIKIIVRPIPSREWVK